jgi:hypothetical protein
MCSQLDAATHTHITLLAHCPTTRSSHHKLLRYQEGYTKMVGVVSTLVSQLNASKDLNRRLAKELDRVTTQEHAMEFVNSVRIPTLPPTPHRSYTPSASCLIVVLVLWEEYWFAFQGGSACAAPKKGMHAQVFLVTYVHTQTPS